MDAKAARPPISTFILAGGKSTRMKKNKAFLEIGGRSSIERVLAVAHELATPVTIVANDPALYRPLGVPVISDSHPGLGPLAGIHAALIHSQATWTLILGCDLPFLSPDLLRRLVADIGPCDAVVPADADGELQSLCALYARSCLPHVIELLDSSERALHLLFPKVRTHTVPFADIRSLAGSERFFFDLDTPQSYQKAKALAQK